MRKGLRNNQKLLSPVGETDRDTSGCGRRKEGGRASELERKGGLEEREGEKGE